MAFRIAKACYYHRKEGGIAKLTLRRHGVRAEGHVSERDVSGDFANAESQISLNVGRVGQIEREGGHHPDIRRASVELDWEVYERL